MNCKRGGFISMRHNNIRDFQANLLTKVCKDVEIEPPLKPVTEEERLTASTLTSDKHDQTFEFVAFGGTDRMHILIFESPMLMQNRRDQLI